MRRCKDCIYVRPVRNPEGGLCCVRYPPTVFTTIIDEKIMNYNIIIQVQADDDCGEFIADKWEDE